MSVIPDKLGLRCSSFLFLMRRFASGPTPGNPPRIEWQELVEEQAVTLVPQKISLEAYRRLLEDLTTRLPVVVALGLQRLGALAGVKLLPPGETAHAVELVRLRRAVVGTPGRPGLVGVLLALARDPHQMLRAGGVGT